MAGPAPEAGERAVHEIEFAVDDVEFAAQAGVLALPFDPQIGDHFAHRLGQRFAQDLETIIQTIHGGARWQRCLFPT